MTGEIYAAIAAVMAEIPAIVKGKQNQQQGFKYRGIDDAYNVLQPLMVKHGVFTTPEVLESRREERVNAKGTVLVFVSLRIKYTFWAKDGSSVYCTVEGEGMDSGDKATSKAMSIAHKYALLQTYCVPTEDMPDPDGESHVLGSKAKAATAQAKENNRNPMTEPQRKTMMAYLTKRHGDKRDEYIKELSDFFGRKIMSSQELTKDDASDFINAINNDSSTGLPWDGAEVPANAQ